MNDMQLHNLYVFLTEKFAKIDERFDAIDARFKIVDERFLENDLKQNEILNAIGTDNAQRDSTIRDHTKRITKLERHATSV